ncbi:MAG: hypothetical protein COB76_05530 [Alphaproteobacteria bacterium]|nr:MAG: hypothetical protein COB76_05530 [Alphaproteobacteria bacterium]
MSPTDLNAKFAAIHDKNGTTPDLEKERLHAQWDAKKDILQKHPVFMIVEKLKTAKTDISVHEKNKLYAIEITLKYGEDRTFTIAAEAGSNKISLCGNNHGTPKYRSIAMTDHNDGPSFLRNWLPFDGAWLNQETASIKNKSATYHALDADAVLAEIFMALQHGKKLTAQPPHIPGSKSMSYNFQR